MVEPMGRFAIIVRPGDPLAEMTGAVCRAAGSGASWDGRDAMEIDASGVLGSGSSPG